MSPRALIAAAAAALAAGCAAQQSLNEAARAACIDEGIEPGPAMDECIVLTEEALQRAREGRTQPPRPPARQNQRPGQR